MVKIFKFKLINTRCKRNLRYYPAKADPTQAMSASNRAVACNGMALRISFSTPDGDVNGVEPVKFIARYELIAVVQSTSANAPRSCKSLRNNTKIPTALKTPVMAPFNAKDRPGIQGSRSGVATAPARIPAT